MNDVEKQKIKKILIILIIVTILAIVGISFFILSLNTGHPKNEVGRFKAQTAGTVSSLAIQCDDNTPIIPDDTDRIDWSDSFSSVDCGPTGKGTFKIQANSKKKNCVATITETGAMFSGPDC